MLIGSMVGKRVISTALAMLIIVQASVFCAASVGSPWPEHGNDGRSTCQSSADIDAQTLHFQKGTSSYYPMNEIAIMANGTLLMSDDRGYYSARDSNFNHLYTITYPWKNVSASASNYAPCIDGDGNMVLVYNIALNVSVVSFAPDLTVNWCRNLTGMPIGLPTLGNDGSYILCFSNITYGAVTGYTMDELCLDGHGQVKWTNVLNYTSTASVVSTTLSQWTAIDDDGTVYTMVLLNTNLTLRCLDAHGNLIWTKGLSYNGMQNDGVHIDASGRALVAESGQVRCYDKKDGQLNWTTQDRVYSSIAVTDDKIIAKTNTDEVAAFAYNGTLLWRYNVEGLLLLTPIIVSGNGIVITSDEASLYLISAESGSLVKKINIAYPGHDYASVVSMAIGNDGTLFLLGWDSTLILSSGPGPSTGDLQVLASLTLAGVVMAFAGLIMLIWTVARSKSFWDRPRNDRWLRPKPLAIEMEMGNARYLDLIGVILIIASLFLPWFVNEHLITGYYLNGSVLFILGKGIDVLPGLLFLFAGLMATLVSRWGGVLVIVGNVLISMSVPQFWTGAWLPFINDLSYGLAFSWGFAFAWWGAAAILFSAFMTVRRMEREAAKEMEAKATKKKGK